MSINGLIKLFFENSHRRNFTIAGIIFFLLSFFHNTYVFSSISPNEFLAINDAPYLVGITDIYNKTFLRYLDDGGIPNSIQAATNFINVLPHFTLYLLGFSIKNTQYIFFTLVFFFTYFIAFIGFYRLSNYYNKTPTHDLKHLMIVLIPTLFYYYSLFNITNMNSGYNFSISYLAYSFFPLLLYYLIKYFDKKYLSSKEVVYLALIMFIIASSITYIIPIFISIIIFLISKYAFKDLFRMSYKYFFYAIFIALLLFFYTLIVFVFELKFNSTNFITENLKNSVAGNIRGGFFYMFLHYFSWGLYTNWQPRSVMTFYEYYLSIFFKISIISVYVVMFVLLVKNKVLTNKAIPYIGILLAAIFFAKGPQDPMGSIFTFLLNKFSLFGMVRSPDNKFGIAATFSIAVLVLLILQNYQNSKIYNYLKYYFLAIILITAVPVLTGEVMQAKDEFPESGRLVTSIIPEYLEVLNILNKDNYLNNVLIYPQPSNVINHDNHLFIGRDVLRTQTKKPFLYNVFIRYDGNGLSRLLSSISDDYNFNNIKLTNIKYILLRKDDFYLNFKKTAEFIKHLESSGIANKIVDNSFLNLYEVNEANFTSRINIPNGKSDLKFANISPIKYKISIKNINNKTELHFLESFNKYFKLYLRPQPSGLDCQPPEALEQECQHEKKFFEGEDLSYLFKQPIFDSSHKVANDYANTWMIDPEDVKKNYPVNYYYKNPDGSINIDLVLYFLPQSYYYLGLLISGVTLIVVSGYLIWNVWKNKKMTITANEYVQ